MMKKLLLFLNGCVFTVVSFAQQQSANASDPGDTSSPRFVYLKEITIVGSGSKSDIHQLPEIVGTSIFAGKKNSLVVIDNVNGNIVNNTMRQVVAKIPGIQIWESDGSGIQIGIAARGLSPNRSWEFNIRQNGYDISSDPFGYPEAYYTPQLQAVQRIQVVRGAGSIQYGPQFGGMVNFILRDGSDISKPFQFETQNTVGSFGLVNTYNAIGGETSKAHYYAFFDHRNADGWRQNSRYNVNTGFATASYKLSDKFKLGVEYMRWNMRSQQPGGLTDAQFNTDARKSSRSRNWFDIVWNTAAINSDYYFSANNRLNVKLYTVLGDRNSIGFLQPITVKDSINASTLTYNNRTVDIDKYRNAGAEARYLGDYRIGKTTHTISGGIRYFYGKTDRFRNGKGDTGSDYNINIEGVFPTDLDLTTSNVALFAENIFRITDKLIIIPGIRFENIRNSIEGRVGISNGTEIKAANETRTRRFVLAAVGAEYHIGETELYANFAQAYRPALFSDLTANVTTDVIDPNLEDAKGYNIDFGYRGKVKDFLFFDVSAFYLRYNNRIGTLSQQRTDGSFYNFRTNVGNSVSKGVEALVEIDPIKIVNANPCYGSFSIFSSFGFTDARYGNLKVITKNGNNLVESNLKNKYVENAPERIFRAGISYLFKGLAITYQVNSVSAAYSDANNTVAANAASTSGLIPAYVVSDVSASYKFNKAYSIKAGINNLYDAVYFTRRAGGYPGPGVLPADGRSFFVTVGAKF
ncbi:MAG: TonB-dependent receptor [Actinobacteria bacterium]|nr:TonB-dependent receptor [Actinomycetota bacterium]